MSSEPPLDFSFFSYLNELLRELLKDDSEARELAEKLLKAYRERGIKGVREELRLLLEEATRNGAEDQENRS